MSEKLIVGLDGSQLAERVLPYAQAFAKALDAEIVLIRAVLPGGESVPLPRENLHLLPFMVAMPQANPQVEDVAARSERFGAEHYLDSVVKRLGDSGVRATGAEIEGDPARVLVEEAVARDASLILLTTHGRSGLGRWIYGSVAEAVVAQSPVPVLLTRAWVPERGLTSPNGRTRFLVPLDGTQVAERALPVAVKLAKALPADIHLVEVVPSLGEMSMSDEAWLGESPEDVQKAEEKEATNYIATVGRRLRDQGINVTSTVRVDSIGAGIIASAGANEASLVVLATHAPKGIERVLTGSIASEVLHRGTLPVLVVGPAAAKE